MVRGNHKVKDEIIKNETDPENELLSFRGISKWLPGVRSMPELFFS